MPDAVFEPILDDDERHQLGLRCREAGRQAATEPGCALTAPHLSARVAAAGRDAAHSVRTAPSARLSPARSAITSATASQATIPIPRLDYPCREMLHDLTCRAGPITTRLDGAKWNPVEEFRDSRPVA